MKNDELFMIYGTDYKEMTRQLLEKAGLEDRIFDKYKEEFKNTGMQFPQNMRIGIKPNLVSPSKASWGATTHPEIVAGIIEYLQERNFINIVIMEGSWVGDKTEEAVKVCGYDRLIKDYGVEFWDMQKDESYEKDCAGMKLQICSSVDKIDFLINVPVLKGHCQTKITCALKNMKGLIPNKEKRHFHKMGLHKPIAHLNAGIHQDFIVVDNICGDLDFEDGGNPVVMNRIFAAVDPVLCDTFVCKLLHYRKEEVPYLVMAEKLGVGCADIDDANLRELNHQKEENAEIPAVRKIVTLKDAVEEVESCSACYGYLIPALEQLRKEGLLEKLNDKIAIGQGYRGKTGKLGVGNCTSRFEYCVKGCPPTEKEIYVFLKKYVQTGYHE